MTVLIQGFGAVGANLARLFSEESTCDGPVIVGISDEKGYLYNPSGLKVDDLLQLHEEKGLVTLPYFLGELNRTATSGSTTYSSKADNLLREHAFCFIPAAPVANYLGIDDTGHPSMTIDKMGRWRLIVEGANTYSPDPERKAARSRMEREVYRQRGVVIAADFLVNSGGVIFAAQERAIPTPFELQIPADRLGNPLAVEEWLKDHKGDFESLAERRRIGAISKRDKVIRNNMKALVDHLLEDVNILPCEAAEMISVSRMASSESDRRVGELMEPLPTIPVSATGGEASRLMVTSKTEILAVTAEDGKLAGVITDWDLIESFAKGYVYDIQLKDIMTADVIAAGPLDTILDVLEKLEQHEIAAMPVVEDGRVIGVINSDILARRTLHRLLQVRGSTSDTKRPRRTGA